MWSRGEYFIENGKNNLNIDAHNAEDELRKMTDRNLLCVNELFSDQIIDRAPDTMIDILDGNIILAYRDCILYTNIKEQLKTAKKQGKHEFLIG